MDCLRLCVRREPLSSYLSPNHICYYRMPWTLPVAVGDDQRAPSIPCDPYCSIVIQTPSASQTVVAVELFRIAKSSFFLRDGGGGGDDFQTPLDADSRVAVADDWPNADRLF